MKYKTCVRCKEALPATVEWFFKDHRGKFGLRSKCKVCFSAESKSFRLSGAERKARELPVVPCACGCGEMIVPIDKWGRARTYVSGHNVLSPIEQRFWGKVRKSEGCWEWQASRAKRVNGWGDYGRIRLNGATLLAHRVSWELANGPIPDGMLIRHTCDNPPCVNPAHLVLGTAHDNNLDMLERGRATNGERNSQTRLSVEQVIEMRRLWEQGASGNVLAQKFSVTRGYAYAVIKRRAWGHI